MSIALLVFLLCFILIFLIRIPIAPGMMMASLFYFALASGPAADLGMAGG